MKPIRQILRQPIKTVIGVILLTLATAALCVCGGQYWAAAQTRAAVERGFTTIAIPTNYYQFGEKMGEYGLERRRIMWEQPSDVVRYLDSLPEVLPDSVQEVSRTCMISAYAPQLDPVPRNSFYLFPTNYDGDPPESTTYGRGIFEIELTELGEPAPWSSDPVLSFLGGGPGDDILFAHAVGTVVRTLVLNDHYPDPVGRKAHVIIQVSSPDGLWELGLEAGKRYLVYTPYYIDTDWKYRTFLADDGNYSSQPFDPKDIDWERDLDTSYINPYFENVGIINPAGTQTGVYVTPGMLELMNASLFEIFTAPQYSMDRTANGNIAVTHEGETREIPIETWLETYQFPSIQEITTTAEDLLENDSLWRRTAEEIAINNRTVPVLGTGRLEAMVPFAGGTAQITEGRAFTDKEYREGSPVCLISETVATQQGLSVGDTLQLSFYEWDSAAPFQPYLGGENPSAAFYHSFNGFSQEGDYEIIGLYRQSNEWSWAAGTFTPLTVLVPKESIRCDAYQGDRGVYYSLILRNGTEEALLENAAQAGYPELFVVYDQGYGDIAPALAGYTQAAGSVLWIGLGIWAGVTLLYLILYPLQMGRDARQMWTLGAEKREIFRDIFLSGAVPMAAGGILAILPAVWGREKLFSQLAESMENASSASILQLLSLCAVSTAAGLILNALCALWITRRREKA